MNRSVPVLIPFKFYAISVPFFYTTTWLFPFCQTVHFRVLQCQCSSCERLTRWIYGFRQVHSEENSILSKPRLLPTEDRSTTPGGGTQRKPERNCKVFSVSKGNGFSCQMPWQRTAIKSNRSEANCWGKWGLTMSLRPCNYMQFCCESYSLSLSMILRCRKTLGWTWRGSACCQMIREENKAKCLE